MIQITIITLICCLLFGVPIAFAIGIAGTAGLYFGSTAPMFMVVKQFFEGINSFSYMAIPLFILAGAIMGKGGISKRIVNFASAILSWLRGGTAITTVGASMIFAAVSGSGAATISAIGGITVPEMLKKGYSRGFTAAMSAGAGSLGPIVPPSVDMIVFGCITGFSISRLFVGGIIPGFIIGLSLMIYCYIYAKKRNIDYGGKFRGKVVWAAFKDSIWALLMPIIIIGGVMGGAFTATEAGAVACVYGLIMAEKLLLGVDLGGSSSKATLIDSQGNVLATASREYPAYSPKPGWLEQDADDLFDAVIVNIKACIEKAGIDGKAISALAIDAATHMAVLCGADDKPLRRFIHWSDARSGAQTRFLKENCSELLRESSVNSVSPAWTLPQMMWLRENEPEVIKNTRRVYFAKDYVRHRITGDFCTDSIEAMGAMLCNDHTSRWVPELCELAGVSADMLPEIKQPGDIAGFVLPEIAAATGLAAGTPVITGTTDTALEVYASGAIAEGCATVKLATAGRICPITSGPIASHQFFNYRHVIPGLWYPGTGTRSCAASYKWYRDIFGTDESRIAEEKGTSAYEVLNRAAEAVPAGSEKLYFHPYLLGEMTPYYDDKLRASFVGAGMHHTKGHFTRAVMEGISYSMRDCLEEIKAQKIAVSEYRIIGGGAKGKLWRQILADVLATPLTSTVDNDSSLGSAMLAGVATGVFADFDDSVKKCVTVADVVTPIPENVEIYEKGFKDYRTIQKALAEVYHDII